MLPLRRLRLRLWLQLMAALEARGLNETRTYYWIARRAMACNPWRRWT
jgi:hypothetical protein